MKNPYKILVGKPDGKSVKRMELKETKWKFVDSIHLAHDSD
jgi:hypothetical protein